jgi:hypothetical protein
MKVPNLVGEKLNYTAGYQQCKVLCDYTRRSAAERLSPQTARGNAATVQAKELWGDFWNCARLRTVQKNGHMQVLLPKVQVLLHGIPPGRRLGAKAPTSQGNWRSNNRLASWAVSGAGSASAAGGGGGGASHFRRRRLRAKARPPRAPLRRFWEMVSLKRTYNSGARVYTR